MWNPNSDNNNLKDVSVAETTNNFVDNKSVVGAGASQQHQQQQKQRKQQMPSNISSSGNGKTTKTATTINKNFEGGESTSNYLGDSSGVGGDGHCAADNSSISCSGGIDSGFLSGPQLFEDYDDDNLSSDKSAHNSGGFGGGGKTKQPPVQLNIVDHKKEHCSEDYLDSGCIDEDFVEDDDQGHHQQKPSITTTAASPQAHQQRGTTTVTATDNKEFDQDEQMILDSGVDAGVSEWMCKLTLRDPNQQVNNLGAAGQRVPNQKEDTSDMSSWEVYYQQNNEGDTQLHLACITGFVDVVAALIRMAPHPCLFNIQNDEAQTSLHLAVIYGQPKILRMLLIAGAEPTARDRHGNTPLHLACISGDTQCVKALTIPISASEINEAHRSYGHLSSDKTTSYLDCARLPADLEIRNYDGERCVHLAAQGGHIDILRHLVWFGADINAREGKSGRTPLHIAIECCNEILANFLLEECSKLNLETATYAGLTAYQVACILDNPTMQNYLEKRGAETLTPPDSDYDSSDIETDLDDSQMFTFGDTRYFANYNGGNPINVA